MPFALVFIGGMLIVTGFQNTYQQAGALVAGDFSGQPNFFEWFLAIAIVGGIGYYKPLQNVSRLFMGLIIAVLILSKGTGFFAKLNSGLSSAAAAVVPDIGAPAPAQQAASGSSSSSSSSGNVLGALTSVAKIGSAISSIF